MKKIAVRAMATLAIVIALCMFFSGTVRTITTAKVKYTSARQGKFEMVSELTGKIYFKETEELKIAMPEATSLTITRVFVKPGQEIAVGDKLFSASVVDYEKNMQAFQNDYDTAESTLRSLIRQNGEVRLTRNEQAWMEAYFAAQAASQDLLSCRIDVQTLMAFEGLEKPSEGDYPEGASDELIAAIDAQKDAESASDAANATLESLNRYAIDETVWSTITQKKECEDKMANAEAKMTELALLNKQVATVYAGHAGYISEISVEKGTSCDATTVFLKMTLENSAPVIRADISDIKQTVSEGSVVSLDSDRYGRVETAVINTGMNADGTRYADIAITEDVIWAKGSVSNMMQGDITLKLSTRAQEATSLIPPSAVRGSGDDRYVFIAVKESSQFGGTQVKVQKMNITVLNESASIISVSEDLTRSQIIYMEDRAISEGDAVMGYEQ